MGYPKNCAGNCRPTKPNTASKECRHITARTPYREPSAICPSRRPSTANPTFKLLRQQKPNQSERRRESRSERRTKNYCYKRKIPNKRNIRFKRRKKEKSNSDEQIGFLRQCERRIIRFL